MDGCVGIVLGFDTKDGCVAAKMHPCSHRFAARLRLGGYAPVFDEANRP